MPVQMAHLYLTADYGDFDIGLGRIVSDIELGTDIHGVQSAGFDGKGPLLIMPHDEIGFPFQPYQPAAIVALTIPEGTGGPQINAAAVGQRDSPVTSRPIVPGQPLRTGAVILPFGKAWKQPKPD